MKTFLYLFCVSLTIPTSGQTYTIFDFEHDAPEAVTHIFINLSFNKVTEIPVDIGHFRNLEELTMFSQSDIFLENNWRMARHRGVDLAFVPIASIPDEIGQCKNLAVLKIPEGNITSLPLSLRDLNKLHTLQLPTGTNLDALLPHLLSLPALDTLECWLCPLSDENRNMLVNRKPGMQFVIGEDDIYRSSNTWPKYVVDINNNNGIVFHRQIEAEMFIKSMPEEDRSFYHVTLKNK